MKKKAKIITLIVAACLVLSIGILGVFSVTSLNMKVGGNVNFIAEGVSIKVSQGLFKTIDGATYENITTQTGKMQEFAIDTDTPKSQIQSKLDSWSDLQLSLDGQGDAVLHFSVENKMKTPVYVYVDKNLGTNKNMDMIANPNGSEITAETTKNFTITFDILNHNVDAELNEFSIIIEVSLEQKKVLDVANKDSYPNSLYDLESLGDILFGNRLNIKQGSMSKYITMQNPVVLSDDYSWTYQIIAGNFFSTGTGMVACSGTNGSGFISVPSREANIGYSGAQFRFRDEGNTMQIDVKLPSDYNPGQIHHFALVYDATTKTFKAYIDKVECGITYTKGTQGGTFNDTSLTRFLGGYPSADTSNFAGHFCYFGFEKQALTIDKMKEISEYDTVESLIIDMANPGSKYNFNSLGVVSDGKLTIKQGSSSKYITLNDTVILSDDYSWTYQVIADNFRGAGMIANSGSDGSGFITVPPLIPGSAEASAAQFRFRDEGNTMQIDANIPSDYDPAKIHHFALVYDATTKTFKAYIDKVECSITYTKGAQGGTFNNTMLYNFLGGYPQASSNFAGDFYYFEFTKQALTTSQMHDLLPEPPSADSLIIDLPDAQSEYDFSKVGTVYGNKVAVTNASDTNSVKICDDVVLSDDYSWTVEVVVGYIVGGGMIVNTGLDGSGFITVPRYSYGSVPQNTPEFRFRDNGNTMQVDAAAPIGYSTAQIHHYALVYDATTKTFKMYIDKQELDVTYTTGSQGGTFNDTRIWNLFGGYPTTVTSNFAGDFYYFEFTKQALTTSQMKDVESVESVTDSLIIDVSNPESQYDFSELGTVSGGKLTITEGSSTKFIRIDKNITLSDEYSWTVEFVGGNFTGSGMIANSGFDGSGFVTVPPFVPGSVEESAAQFRFRDQGNTMQIDVNLPSDYDPTQIHHYALVYDASTKTFKAYIDKVECNITYTKGAQGGTFNDTQINNLLGGYPQPGSNFAGDFYYFEFTKQALTTGEMYTQPK